MKKSKKKSYFLIFCFKITGVALTRDYTVIYYYVHAYLKCILPISLSRLFHCVAFFP